jgi:hypothetical protein
MSTLAAPTGRKAGSAALPENRNQTMIVARMKTLIVSHRIMMEPNLPPFSPAVKS